MFNEDVYQESTTSRKEVQVYVKPERSCKYVRGKIQKSVHCRARSFQQCQFWTETERYTRVFARYFVRFLRSEAGHA